MSRQTERAVGLLAFTAVWAQGGAGPARAQPVVDDVHAETGVTVFSDSDDTVIWTPHVEVGATVPAQIELGVEWSADIISSASVDVVSAATSRATEQRNQLQARGRRENLLPDTDVVAAYIYSFERDTASHTVDLGVRRGWAESLYETGLRYGLSYNRIGVADQPASDRDTLWVHSAELSGSRAIDRVTLVQVAYALFYADGYQANPYRLVPIGGGASLGTSRGESLIGASWVPERVPNSRIRHALSASGERLIADALMTRAAYRFYWDDWGVTSHTLEGSAAAEVARGLTLLGQVRATHQGAASFYRRQYPMELEYVTRDRRLSEHQSGLVGAAAIWTLRSLAGLEAISVSVHFDVVAWRYGDFDRPELTITSGAQLAPMGTVLGTVTMASLEVRP